jgi:hypothetical protein
VIFLQAAWTVLYCYCWQLSDCSKSKCKILQCTRNFWLRAHDRTRNCWYESVILPQILLLGLL